MLLTLYSKKHRGFSEEAEGSKQKMTGKGFPIGRESRVAKRLLSRWAQINEGISTNVKGL
jgi:hypothetical protein